MSNQENTLPLASALGKPARTVPKLFQDARDFQILYLSVFLLFGISYLGWESDTNKFLVIFGTCLGVQALGVVTITRNWMSMKSAIITALGLCLLLRANDWTTLALAAGIAVAAKFTIRFNNKHLFNPANIGIIAAVLMTGDAWISPGKWGSDWLLLFFIGIMGLVVLMRVGRLDTSLAFLLFFGGSDLIYTCLYLGWPIDHFLQDMKSGTLLLFTFFMITDPATTPDARRSRIIWAALMGVGTFVMAKYGYVHTAPIWALFFVTPLTVVLDRIFKAKKFKWYSDRLSQPKILPKANRTTLIWSVVIAALLITLGHTVYADQQLYPIGYLFLASPVMETVRWIRKKYTSSAQEVPTRTRKNILTKSI